MSRHDAIGKRKTAGGDFRGCLPTVEIHPNRWEAASHLSPGVQFLKALFHDGDDSFGHTAGHRDLLVGIDFLTVKTGGSFLQ